MKIGKLKIENSQRGTSLMDLIISMGILAILFGGIYLVYFSIITAIANVNVRAAASTAIANEIETIRNLPYASVGTVGGIPAGVIPQAQTVTVSDYSFTLETTILNIDDPFDGTLGGNPQDLDPPDYKLVSINATCPLCGNAFDAEVTTTVAPPGLESATQNASLFIYAIDANGDSVQGANIHIVNASVTPSIDLTDTTNASGVLELIGVPTSTLGYSVSVTKPGYSTDQTYAIGSAGNPNPTQPNLTATAQTVTAVTFAIDRLSQLVVTTSDNRCAPVGDVPFSVAGSKMIGTNPTILKFSTSSTTGASGMATLSGLEWDAYTILPATSAEDLAGTLPLDPVVVNPSSSVSFRIIVQSAADPSLLAAVVDSITGAGISNATATLSSGSGFSETFTTGRAVFSQSDWSGSGESGYASQSGGLNANVPGRLTLALNASGTYNVGSGDWLISNTFDMGGSNSNFYTITWSPLSQPPQAGTNAILFQVAANNDNTTWNFVGPDGTSGSYFMAPGPLPAALAGSRYFRYKIFMSTQDSEYTPELDSISFGFTADCVPPAQVLFASLPQGSYTLDVAAQNYAENSTTVSIGSGFQSSTIQLTHL